MRLHNFLFKAVIVLAAGLLNTGLAMPNSTSAITENFALSGEDVMPLDWHLDRSSSATVVQKTDIEGPGIKFTIRFPDNTSKNNPVTYVSCKYGNGGLLTNDFDAFPLKFTSLSVNDLTSPEAAGALLVGALIDKSYTYAFGPEIIGLQPQHNTAVSLTTTEANNISIIGYFFETECFDTNSSTVRFLIEAAPNAEILP